MSVFTDALSSGSDQLSHWKNRVHTLRFKANQALGFFPVQLLIAILARMSSLRVREIGVAIGGPLPVIDGYADISRVVASIIPNWPLERLVIISMRSEVICALLGGAHTKSLRTFELRSQLEPADQPFNGFTDVVSSLHSLASLERSFSCLMNS